MESNGSSGEATEDVLTYHGGPLDGVKLLPPSGTHIEMTTVDPSNGVMVHSYRHDGYYYGAKPNGPSPLWVAYEVIRKLGQITFSSEDSNYVFDSLGYNAIENFTTEELELYKRLTND